MWNGLISFVDESFLLMSISFFASFTQFTFNNYGSIVSVNFSCFAALTMISYPIWITVFLCKKKKKLSKKKFTEKYESAYENLNHK